MKRSAIISDCGIYRYRLEREWGDSGAAVAFIMLNPSTADADVDDPTIRRCIRFAQDWGFAKLIVGNLWAYRATSPKALKAVLTRDGGGAVASGPHNHGHLHAICHEAQRVICAWGPMGALDGRAAQVLQRLWEWRISPHYLRLTKDGQPGHPLYLPGNLKPQRWPA